MIKVCGITNLADAMASIDGGATCIGFNFYPKSKRYITLESAASIAASIPSYVRIAGVFVNEAPARIDDISGMLRLDVAQLHGDESPWQLPSKPIVWKAFSVTETFDPRRLEEYPAVEAFLLDGPAGAEYGGSGKPFAWRLAAELKQRIIIAGGLDASNVRQAIAEAHPWGVDACSRLESSPGRKDLAKLKEFLEAARSAEELQ